MIDRVCLVRHNLALHDIYREQVACRAIGLGAKWSVGMTAWRRTRSALLCGPMRSLFGR